MKKIALLLALAMILAVCAFAVSCTNTPAESSAPADESKPADESTPAESSEEPAPAESSEEPAPAESSEEPAPAESSEEPAPAESSEEPAESSEEPADESKEGADPTSVTTSEDVSKVSGTNIALGCKVSGVDVNTANPNYCANLTDGNASTTITYDNNWFGLYYQDEKEVNAPDRKAKFLLDLGAVKSIGVIRVNFFLGNTSGIIPPETVKIEVSSDGKKFASLGTIDVDNAGEGDTTIGWIGYALSDNVDAQFVRITVGVRGVWCFLNEIEVYA